MLRRLYVVGVVILLLGTILSGTAAAAPTEARGGLTSTSASAAEPTPAALPADTVPAPASGSDIGTLDNAAAQATCNFYADGDQVHLSSTPFAASGHGYWKNRTCPPDTYAVVTVQLQEYYSDGSWRNKGAPAQKMVPPGGGSGKRATARVDCANGIVTGWRSVVHADLVGFPDTSTYITPSNNIACRVY